MKTRLLMIIGIISIVLLVPYFSYGMWREQPLDELWKQSQTIFVGTVTAVNVLEFERSNTYNVEENGVTRIIVENYTQSLDEYTVNIEEFLKNPQESDMITMLEATVGGVPGYSVSIGGFEPGDRVLFYVPKIDGTNQYSPESKIIRTDNQLFYFQDEFKKFASAENKSILSPLKQIRSGIEPKDVICKEGLQLVMKNWKGNWVCVKDSSVEKLIMRNYIYHSFGSSGVEVPSNESISSVRLRGLPEIDNVEMQYMIDLFENRYHTSQITYVGPNVILNATNIWGETVFLVMQSLDGKVTATLTCNHVDWRNQEVITENILDYLQKKNCFAPALEEAKNED